jgi:hypothetical protein
MTDRIYFAQKLWRQNQRMATGLPSQGHRVLHGVERAFGVAQCPMYHDDGPRDVGVSLIQGQGRQHR